MFAREVVVDHGNGPSLVPAVAKAFKLLDELSSAAEPLGVSELSRRLGMGKSTVYGLVTTLASLGMLETTNGSKRYRIGRGLHVLASRVSGDADLRRLVRPSLERLASSTEQTSFLGVPSGDQIVILDLVFGRATMSVSAPVGSSIPLLGGAPGRALLSSRSPDQRRAVVEQAAAIDNGFTDRAAYFRTLDECSTRGWATDADERGDGMRVAAAPVLDATAEPAAVIWVAGFSRHVSAQHLLAIAAEVAREAKIIGSRLGRRP